MTEPHTMGVRVCRTHAAHTLISTLQDEPVVQVCEDCTVAEYISAAWLASDEAVERVAKHLAGPPRCYCPDDWRQPATHCPQHDFASWPEDSHRAEARAVLAALRGDGR